MKILIYGEPLIRFSTHNYESLATSGEYKIHIGGSELNCGVSLAGFNNDVNYLTIIPENELGKKIEKYVVSNRVNSDFIKKSSGRVGIYFLENGFGLKPSNIIYDRDFSSFAITKFKEEDVALSMKNIDILFLSGINCQLSDIAYENTLLVLEVAKRNKIKVFFDVNFRISLANKTSIIDRYENVLKSVDVAFVGLNDLKNIFNLNSEFKEESNQIIDLSRQFLRRYKLECVASNCRKIIKSDSHEVFSYAVTEKGHYFSTTETIDVLDRVGSGDALAAGFINKYDKNNLKTVVDFAFKNFIYKHSVLGDSVNESETTINNVNIRIKDIIR